MKVGDRVSFKSRMWPETVLCVEFPSATGECRDVTGQGLYCGRGRIVGIDGDNYTVREEKSGYFVEVGSHHDEQISPLGSVYPPLTLGHLRAFLRQHEHAPDDMRVMIALPMSFFSDSEDMPSDHSEYKAVSACQPVEVCGISIMGFSEYGDFTDRYIPPGGRREQDWDFSLEITPNPEQCFEAMRGHGED